LVNKGGKQWNIDLEINMDLPTSDKKLKSKLKIPRYHEDTKAIVEQRDLDTFI
jgi:hypothetical protein